MILPNKIEFRTFQFADGVGGWSQQKSWNNEFGIHRTATRMNGELPFKIELTVDLIPGRTFTSLKEIQDYYNGQEAI